MIQSRLDIPAIPLNGIEVEFSDDEGKTYAELVFPPDQLLVLHYRRR